MLSASLSFPSSPPLPFGPLSPYFPPLDTKGGGSQEGERGYHTSYPTAFFHNFFSGGFPPGQNMLPFSITHELLNVFVCSVPDENSALDDRSTALPPEERDPGLFLLRKDSERRAILYRILWEEQNQVASNLQECVVQVQAMERPLIVPPSLPSPDLQQVLTGTVKCPTSWYILIGVVITIFTSQHPSLS